MEIKIKDRKEIIIRLYKESDYSYVKKLNNDEGWSNLVENEELTKAAWRNSNIKYVVEESNKIIGYIRGMTDKKVTLYICEILIDKGYRGFGIGESLLEFVHSLYPKTRMEMIATSRSRSYYEVKGFRSFYGYRKTIGE